MDVLRYILDPLQVAEVDVSNGVISVRKSTAIYSLRTKQVTLHEMNDDNEDTRKNKNAIIFLYIQGSDVVSREHDIQDSETIRKITGNDNLLWTIHKEGDRNSIDFIRKSSLDSEIKEIERKSIYIAGITVSNRCGLDIHEGMNLFYRDKLNIDLLKKSREFRGFFFDSLFYKIRLPILLFLLLLLLVNYLVFSNLKEKYDVSEAAYTVQLQKMKRETQDSEKTHRLFDEYNKIPYYPLAVLSDRIASYMPKDVRLTSMVFFPETRSNIREKNMDHSRDIVVLKGNAGIAGTVLLFTHYLQEDKLFNKVGIINITNLEGTDLYNFELEVEL